MIPHAKALAAGVGALVVAGLIVSTTGGTAQVAPSPHHLPQVVTARVTPAVDAPTPAPVPVAVPAPAVVAPKPVAPPAPAPVAVTPTPTPSPVVTPAPAAPAPVIAPPATSTNWAGYVAWGTHTAVSTSFVVPLLTSCGAAELSYSEFWAGLGGWNGSGSVEQSGVNVECNHGTVYYQPWYEMAPGPLVLVSTMGVAPGDTVTASAVDLGNGTYRLGLTDATNGGIFSIDAAPTQGVTSDASAECVAENNAFDNPVATYANYAPVTFSGCSVTGGFVVNTVDNGTEVAVTAGPVSGFTVSRT